LLALHQAILTAYGAISAHLLASLRQPHTIQILANLNGPSCCAAGWSFQKSGLSCRREGDVAIYGVPYSEHSSFAELRDCVKTLRPRRIVPTVNASTPAASRALVDRWAHPRVHPSCAIVDGLARHLLTSIAHPFSLQS
jgi:hypothetical protein